MNGSTSKDVRAVNERFERRELAKKLLITIESTSARLADAERLAPAVSTEVTFTLTYCRDAITRARLAVNEILKKAE